MLRSAALLFCCVMLFAPQAGANPSTPSTADWQLVFSDEFDDTTIDGTKWNTPDQARGEKNGIRGFWRPDNVTEHDGALHIRFRQDDECPDVCYSAGAAATKGKFSLTYGRIEARIDVIRPDGAQSAFWLMPAGAGMADDNCAGAANDGAEIDILEGGRQSERYHTDIHWNGYGDCHAHAPADVPASGIHNGYHVFGVEWTPTALRFTYDGQVVRTVTDVTRIPDVAQYLRLSGGNFGCSCVDGDIRQAELPVTMRVDWIRVYQEG
jgi:beta-glucanase (GH16 family)